MKRATDYVKTKPVSTIDFNPRPREEGDMTEFSHILRCFDFNPRPREEGDHEGILDINKIVNFNPRPREEGDATNYLVDGGDLISIHALVKRATTAR